MDLSQLTQDQTEILLYMEKQSVEHGCTFGLFDSALKGDGFDRLSELAKLGLLRFGRITWATMPDIWSQYWVEFSDEGWSLAHAIRRARAGETMATRAWQKLDEADHPEKDRDDLPATLDRWDEAGLISWSRKGKKRASQVTVTDVLPEKQGDPD